MDESACSAPRHRGCVADRARVPQDGEGRGATDCRERL